tara:strand:+ start:6317 stop:6760 length:444 start_codon:yes stop_codon:yes gene_type:complete
MTRNFARRVARWLIGVVLLAQMSIAAYACPGISSALQAGRQATAIGMPMAEPTDAAALRVAAQEPACDDMAGAMDPTSANLCAEHCKYGQQSDHASTVNVPATALVALYSTPAVPEPVPLPQPALASMSALVAACPPHAILHCVYRI